jgi:Protein tyrosine and serine/threonine kinase
MVTSLLFLFPHLLIYVVGAGAQVGKWVPLLVDNPGCEDNLPAASGFQLRPDHWDINPVSGNAWGCWKGTDGPLVPHNGSGFFRMGSSAQNLTNSSDSCLCHKLVQGGIEYPAGTLRVRMRAWFLRPSATPQSQGLVRIDAFSDLQGFQLYKTEAYPGFSQFASVTGSQWEQAEAIVAVQPGGMVRVRVEHRSDYSPSSKYGGIVWDDFTVDAFVPESPPSPAADSASSTSSSEFPVVIVVVVVAGVLVLCIAAGAAVAFFARRRKRSDSNSLAASAAAADVVEMQSEPATPPQHRPTGAIFDGTTVLDGVTIERQIGKGAFGDVYLGTWSGAAVAIKQLTESADPGELEQELGVLQRLNHPNTVRFYGLHLLDGSVPGLVLEFCEGGSLDTALKSGDVAPADFRGIVVQIARGLEYLASQGFCHREYVSFRRHIPRELLLALTFTLPSPVWLPVTCC